MAVTTGSLESLRELNRLRVVDALKALGTTSRAELARRTGLSRSTVSTLVAELVRQGFVVEGAPGDGGRLGDARIRPGDTVRPGDPGRPGDTGRPGSPTNTPRPTDARDGQQGRPPVMLTLNLLAGVAVGIDFSHDVVRVAVSDLSRTVLNEAVEKVDVDHDAELSMAVAAALVGDLRNGIGTRVAPRCRRRRRPSAPIDYERGTVHPS